MRASLKTLLGVVGLQLLLVGSLSAAPAASASSTNVVQSIEVAEKDASTEITIHGTNSPTFTVFKLEDPIRVFIDMVDADMRAVDGTLEFDNGVIAHIGTLQFARQGDQVGRIILVLDRNNLYNVESVGNDIRIVIDAEGRRSTQGIASAGELEERSQVKDALEREKTLLQQIKLARLQEEALKNQAEDARRSEETLRKQVEDARRQAESRRTEEQERVKALRVEKKKLEKALAKREAIETELKTLSESVVETKKLDRMQMELSSARVIARRAEQEKKAALAEAAVREQMLKSQVEDSLQRTSELSKELATSSGRVAELEGRITELKTSAETDRVAAERLETLMGERDRAVDERASLEKSLVETRASQEEYRKRVAMLEKERGDQVGRLEEALDQAKLRTVQKEQALITEQTRLRDEQEAYRMEAESRLAGLQPEVTALRSAVEERKGALRVALLI